MSTYNRTSAFPRVSMTAGYFNDNTIKIYISVYDSSGNIPVEVGNRYLDLKSAKELLNSLENSIRWAEQG